jgi:hypothetical protein
MTQNQSMCLRGDHYNLGTGRTHGVQSPGFRRYASSSFARQKCRIFQLDFVGAFLQSYAVDRTVTTLPHAWLNYFPNYPNGWYAPSSEISMVDSIAASHGTIICRLDDKLWPTTRI